MRGGVSDPECHQQQDAESSPYAWGCFDDDYMSMVSDRVFPICVGVFLDRIDEGKNQKSLPHMRGGVSLCRLSTSLKTLSSPHAWGCFLVKLVSWRGSVVFPTCVGVFLFIIRICLCGGRLPHMRGGVSPANNGGGYGGGSSPHAWGCFPISAKTGLTRYVFPTCVGVFLISELLIDIEIGLPHMRGGVSSIICGGIALRVSSPHAWGCFPAAGRRADGCRVFPTCVGVFLHHV
ncbi:Domain of uncharacterised function (DUF2825) [Klebsiella pneumoniae]|nr:Domain of uncharacterised function (DUF2825) [Klebsiella pneumoniae]SXU65986.1 Domain of uncharacterised function (DUF2825) [Klebsiella pneumoniae]